MAIREQTQQNRPPRQQGYTSAEGAGSRASAEWIARPLRPVASWVLVPQAAGAARLEMVWRVPDPQAADAA
jgi:hypothetical protein